jgi:hypothetical protein
MKRMSSLLLASVMILIAVPQGSEAKHGTFASKDYPSDLLIALAISGGGFRSATFAYAAMNELNNMWLCNKKDHQINIVTDTQECEGTLHGQNLGTVLDNVAVISAVSGGALPAAYYVQYGKESFLKDFKEKVLPLSTELAPFLREQSFPVSKWDVIWDRLPGVAGSLRAFDAIRDDLKKRTGFMPLSVAAELLDKKVFDKPADVSWAESHELLIHATDLTNSRMFTFHDDLDLSCVQESEPTMGKMVAATAALPGLVQPLELHRKAPNDLNPWCLRHFRDSRKATLVDGGVYDNLAIDGLLRYLVALKGRRQQEAPGKELRVLVIAINAAPPAAYAAIEATEQDKIIPYPLVEHLLRGFDVLTSHRSAISRSLFDEIPRYGIAVAEFLSVHLLTENRSEGLDGSGLTRVLAGLSTISWFPNEGERDRLQAAARLVVDIRRPALAKILSDLQTRRLVPGCEHLMDLEKEYCWPPRWIQKNPFEAPLESLLKDIHDDKTAVIKRQEKFLNEGIRGGLQTLRNAMDRTKCGDKVYAVDYGLFEWTGNFSDYQKANEEALKRGVEMHRVFVVPDGLLNDTVRLSNLIEAMQQQARMVNSATTCRGGITIKLALKSELEKSSATNPSYSFKQGMVLFDYHDHGRLLVEEVIPYAGEPAFPGHYYAVTAWFALPDEVNPAIDKRGVFLRWLNDKAPADLVCGVSRVSEHLFEKLRKQENPCRVVTGKPSIKMAVK